MGSPADLEHSRLTNLRVLIAEDDADVAESLDLYLQLFSCKVDRALDGPQALGGGCSWHLRIVRWRSAPCGSP